MIFSKKNVLTGIAVFLWVICYSAHPIIINDNLKSVPIGKHLEILEDVNSAYTLAEVVNRTDFFASEMEVPNLQISKSTFWVRFTVENQSSTENFLLNFAYPMIDEVVFFHPTSENRFIKELAGENVSFSNRKYYHQNFIFDLNILKNESSTFYMRIKSGEQIMLPITLGTNKSILQTNATLDLYNGIYFGIVLVMLIYNLFIFFSVRDKSYLLYVVYILFVGLVQASDSGYAYRILWPQMPAFANFMVTFLPAMVGISAVVFMRKFLNTKTHIPNADKFFFVFIGAYVFCTILFAAGFPHLSYQLMQANALLVSLYMLAMAYRIVRKGYRPAKFFLAAWAIFLISVCLFVMKDFGVIPYNYITKHILQFGSAIELILLSFALANKINILKKEKEESQLKTLDALKENERIMREQNIFLEKKVKERTVELEKTNHDLGVTLTDLKETQAQLVDAEKMASLGQLTAGIAHEINNPINFVVANIKPLKRDILDVMDVLAKYDEIKDADGLKEKLDEVNELKEELDLEYVVSEIDLLLKGIDDGANRTADIIKGLRTFSRLDESDLKKADINDGLDSTLLLLNSLMEGKITIVKSYDELPPVECYAGKLNQVFMNIIKNAAQAVATKKFQQGEKPCITITTKMIDEDILVSVKDNGPGMKEAITARIFEPFFTTKEVGEGTGLGLSIAYNIIDKHHGFIDVESEPGTGTEFIILIPKEQTLFNTEEKSTLAILKEERRKRLINRKAEKNLNEIS